MRLFSVICLFLLPLAVSSQSIDLAQSSPDINWEIISNDYVRIIYPDYLKKDSVTIANLVEHYGHVVGKTYGVAKPQSFTLVLRPEVAAPNGFVSLAPRRSEWFASSNFSNFIGGSAWYQSLSIHEYRHVLQFDYFNQGFVKFANFFFGDIGKALTMFTGLQPWYFEGDAVWAETKYTDSGRGRSPLFTARLKALVGSDQIPTYDELVAGTYNTYLPNHYVFGYVLIAKAYDKFGDDFWKRVIKKVAQAPHPYRLYSAFESESGQNFFDFYDEVMKGLKEEWKNVAHTKTESREYRENTYPHKIGENLFYLYRNLDGYWELRRRDSKGISKILDIPFSSSISQIDMASNFAVYAEFLPHKRYAHKGSSDLFLIDLKSGEKTKLTQGKRLYNPSISQNGKEIWATSFNDDHRWVMHQYDLKGKLLREMAIKGHNVSEVYPLDSENVIAILSDNEGQKLIAKVNTKTGDFETLLPASRNIIHELAVDELKNVYFEAQYKGSVDIFRIAPDLKVARCTTSDIGAFTPMVESGNLYYSEMDANGSHLAQTSIKKCRDFSGSELVGYKYLDEDSSKMAVAPIPQNTQYESEDYGDIDSRLFTPHSWSFFGGRGFELSAATDNYLRTMAINASVGVDASEDETFGTFRFDFKKYYPIFRLHAELRNRSSEIFGSSQDLEWNEREAGLSILLPYLFKRGLYNFSSYLTLGGSYLDTRDYEGPLSRDDSYFYVRSSALGFSWSKDLKPRSIISPVSFSLATGYDEAENKQQDIYSSNRFFLNARLQVPALFNHDGFFVTYNQEKQRDSRSAYRFIPEASTPINSVFSRGYNYDAVSEYRKVTGNYIFPIAYPDLNLWGVYYLKRLYSTLFFDSTRIESQYANATLNSYGAELEFESRFFRILPLNFGVRYAHRMLDEHAEVEGYLATGLEF